MSLIDLEVLLRTPYVEPHRGFDLSPDGDRVVFSWNKTGQWELFEMDLSGEHPPRQLTKGKGGKFAPHYHPEGTSIAYVLDEDGGESFDIYLYDLTSRKHINLTPQNTAAIQPNLSWSPAGNELAFLCDRSGCFHTYILTVDSGKQRLVLDLPHPDWDVAWSPDGDHLAVTAETTAQDYGLFLVDLTGDKTTIQVSDSRGPLNAREPSWSPSGDRVAFTSDAGGQYRIGVFEVDTGDVSWVTEGPGDDKSPHWSPAGDQIAFVRWSGPTTVTALLSLETKQVTTHPLTPGVHYHPLVTSDAGSVVFIFGSADQPQDLFILNLQSGNARQLTQSLPDPLLGETFVMPEEIEYRGLDGECIPALLYTPDRTTHQASVIYIHGGPNWLSQVCWSPEIQHFVSRGWVVLAPNYRGSIGYGRAWQLSSRFDLGGVDTRDVVAGADYLINHNLTNPNRIAVTGRSHGGYLTMTALTQYPDKWAAGSAVVPFLNWFTSHENAREDLQHWDIENMGDPEENQTLWYERSPYFYLDQIQAPVQLICGENDPRCPASESTDAKDKLKEMGKTVELELYEEEGHAFLKTENVIDAERKRVAFLARALEQTDNKENIAHD